MNLERIGELVYLFERAPIAHYLGMKLSFDDQGNAIVELPHNPNLDHPLGGVHGGVYATLLDTAGWYTAAAGHDPGSWLATAEMSIHFLLPVERTALRAVGRPIRRGKHQDVAEVHLYDGEGRLVAHATGTFVLLSNVPVMAVPDERRTSAE
jgi:uncharacterized protein (TIGR00369 family)